MDVQTLIWTAPGGWRTAGTGTLDRADLVLYFAAPSVVADGSRLRELRARFPGGLVLGCTTGGEILGRDVHDESLVVAAVKFAATRVEMAMCNVEHVSRSATAGEQLGRTLARPDLRFVFVLSDGIVVNGSELVRGLRRAVGENVIISGGLAGDGPRFGRTVVGTDTEQRPGTVIAVGFHGSALRIGTGSVGGWETFGPQRMVTRAVGNVLHELDGKPALDLYKKYLGEEAARLPGSALLFPLSVRRAGEREGDLVRTVVAIDEATKTMTFAGDVPEGARAQLMRGSIARLVRGAEGAAQAAFADGLAGRGSPPKEGGKALALLVSCIGRKLFMGQRASDEVEAVADALGEGCDTVGFYSYGEISPHAASGVCELHNQTMTVTTLSEED